MAFTPIYSALFLRESGLTGPVFVDIGADQVFILRDVAAYNGTEGVTSSSLFIMDTATNATVVFMEWGPGETGMKQWHGRQVFVPFVGNTIQVRADTATDVSLSGYILTQPPA